MAAKKVLTIVITRGNDQFGAWIEEVPGVYGAGDTVEEAKQDLEEGLKLFIEVNEVLPEALKGEYLFTYTFDTQSFLEYYSKILSRSGLEKITGINQRQLGHYLTGVKKPSSETVKKIDESLHRFAKELQQVHFV